MTFKQAIKNCNFDYINSEITTKNFPDFNKMPNEPTELMHFDKNLTSEEVLERIKKQGMRPANVKELLAYAKENPDEQYKYPIIALGSSCNLSGFHCFQSLWSVGSERRLGLDWIGNNWSSDCRFLAVRKSQNPLENGH